MTGYASFHVADGTLSEAEKLQQRQALAKKMFGCDFAELFDVHLDAEKIGKKNCENFMGSVEVPVGIAGPVAISSDVFSEEKEIFLPLATTEGALVASIQRGCKAINAAGNAKIFVKKIGMSRAPVFRCEDGTAALQFANWIDEHISEFAAAAEKTSQHLHFLSHHSWVRGRNVYVRFVFDSEEAMGMNMVSIAVQTAWVELQKQHPHVELLSLTSNVCTDKKDSVINRLFGRGYWVQAEAFLPAEVLKEVLKTNAERFFDTHLVKNLVGSNIAGSFSQNMQIGNAVAAMYLAMGQDMAHVTEGSQAATTVEKETDGLYIAVTLPNVVVGTVGGGTWLPAQTQAREIIRGGKSVDAKQLAAAIGVAALAGEISGLSALSVGQLAAAHAKLGRSGQ